MSKVKLYPVCNWERNQPKMYNYNDKMYIRSHEGADAGSLGLVL